MHLICLRRAPDALCRERLLHTRGDARVHLGAQRRGAVAWQVYFGIQFKRGEVSWTADAQQLVLCVTPLTRRVKVVRIEPYDHAAPIAQHTHVALELWSVQPSAIQHTLDPDLKKPPLRRGALCHLIGDRIKLALAQQFELKCLFEDGVEVESTLCVLREKILRFGAECRAG